jgi:hypothetical protein
MAKKLKEEPNIEPNKEQVINANKGNKFEGKPKNLVYIGKKELNVYVQTISDTLQYVKHCIIESFYPSFQTHSRAIVKVLEALEAWGVKYKEETHYIFKQRSDSFKKSSIIRTEIKVI